VETRTESIKTIAELNGVRSWTLYRDYKQVSGYEDWEQRHHSREYLVFPENIGERLSIDEVSLNKGELYTFLTNKAAKGRKGTLVASIHGTKTNDIVLHVSRIPLAQRQKVKEVTLDLASNLARAVRELFPNARLVSDRFHIMQLAYEVVQQHRVEFRSQAIEEENEAVKQAKKQGIRYIPPEYHNGDTRKQLLARSRYGLYKHTSKWTNNQWLRMGLLFQEFPELKTAYEHVQKLVHIYRFTDIEKAELAFRDWIKESHKMKLDGFKRVADTFENHLQTILNFYYHRSTNAAAEAFNAKVKLFRAIQRGVTDTEFFLFRLSKLYA